MQDTTARWYVIQVISGTEENVKQSLFQRRESFGLEDHIIDLQKELSNEMKVLLLR